MLLAGVAIGSALGAVNGVLVWKLGIPPIVVTLGTLTIYRGMIFVLAGGTGSIGRQMSAGLQGVPAHRDPRPADAVVDRDRRHRVFFWLMLV